MRSRVKLATTFSMAIGISWIGRQSAKSENSTKWTMIENWMQIDESSPIHQKSIKTTKPPINSDHLAAIYAVEFSFGPTSTNTHHQKEPTAKTTIFDIASQLDSEPAVSGESPLRFQLRVCPFTIPCVKLTGFLAMSLIMSLFGFFRFWTKKDENNQSTKRRPRTGKTPINATNSTRNRDERKEETI